ncbi:PMS1 protein-like protein 1 [Cercospora zeina]
MGIQALPQSTVRVLGASQVLTDPAAVVKELLDNAYDANATSIAVEIHCNTVDVIQVRDNGHGIVPEDRALVARRYCTSKISHDDDLKDLGGSSLGFRGEALASAAELSGSLTISTKIEGEQVAAALKINQKGEIVAQEKASLPVGTTVRITDFIKANPVRRQVVVKNTESCLKKIKRTLQAYAFARPRVRLSLKVLKAKNNKYDWIYAPQAGGNAEDAAFKVVGAACASQCIWSILEDGGFTLQAFLPRPDADASKTNGIGAYISVDARPVSAARGVFKQIVKVFREAFRKVAADTTDVKDPFLYLELSCPRGSYDANLEPAKDDLLFEDPALVVEIARRLFSAAYTEQEAISTHPEIPDVLEQQLQQESADPVGRSSATSVLTRADAGSVQEVTHLEEDELPVRAYRSTMYGCDEEDLGMLDQRPPSTHIEAEFEELRRSKNDVTVSNPWVTAKFNASLRRSPPAPDDRRLRRQVDADTASLSAMSSSPAKQQRNIDLSALPTPRPSSPTANAGFHPAAHVQDVRLARDGRFIGSSALPPPQAYTPAVSSNVRGPVEYNYGPSFGPPTGTPLECTIDSSPTVRRNPRKPPAQNRVNKPFQLPTVERPPRENVWFDHLQQPRFQKGRAQNHTRHNEHAGLVIQGELGDLVDEPRALTPPRRNRDIRDFVGSNRSDSISSMIELRNYGASGDTSIHASPELETLALTQVRPISKGTRQPRGFVPASEVMGIEEEATPSEQGSKHAPKRRKTGERRALKEMDVNAPIAMRENLSEEEYRPNTGKRSLSRKKSSNKLGRTKSSKLPLERTPAGQGTHALVLPYNTSPQAITELADKADVTSCLLNYNEPAIPMARGLDSASSRVLSLTASLHQLLVSAGGDKNATSPEALLSEVKAAFAQRAHVIRSLEEDDETLMSASN